jgi:integrase
MLTSTAAYWRAIRRARCFGQSGAALASSRTTPLLQANAYAMIRRRAAAAGIAAKIGNHSFRATGITDYLKSGGALCVLSEQNCRDGNPKVTVLC